eukprot:TRINITY_DN479_c0_g1_i2.p1 TRINITY_DN479_c0_g1~~TRINITY_DN479_c0_g1_i2.p1  ORF type:complete len:279 (+),score=39.83 TRINITY_DN479_c0_g1_i2:40-837(+)
MPPPTIPPTLIRYTDIGKGPYRMAGTILQFQSTITESEDKALRIVYGLGLRQVVRSNDVTFDFGIERWYSLRNHVLTKVPLRMLPGGRSSYVRECDFVTTAGKKMGSVRTVIVLTDSSLTRTVPVPDEVKEMMDDVPVMAPERLPKIPPRPTTAFRWRTTARWTEIDQLGHVNQSIYALLMEEARAVASSRGGYGEAGAAASRCPPRRMVIDYSGQAMPGDDLSVHTWWDGELFFFELERDATESAPAKLLTSGRLWPRLPTAKL